MAERILFALHIIFSGKKRSKYDTACLWGRSLYFLLLLRYCSPLSTLCLPSVDIEHRVTFYQKVSGSPYRISVLGGSVSFCTGAVLVAKISCFELTY